VGVPAGEYADDDARRNGGNDRDGEQRSRDTGLGEGQRELAGRHQRAAREDQRLRAEPVEQ
jgi:hypothetical protein